MRPTALMYIVFLAVLYLRAPRPRACYSVSRSLDALSIRVEGGIGLT